SVEPAFRSLGVAIKDVKSLDSILLVGADPRMEVPVLAIDIRTATKNGAKVALLNTYDTDQLHPTEAVIAAPNQWVNVLANVLAAVSQKMQKTVAPELASIVEKANSDARSIEIANMLGNDNKQWIVLSIDAVSNPDFSVIRALCHHI